jgi:hypothetical protein
MKETHLVGYILTYIALFVSKNSEVSLKIKAFENLNQYIIYIITILPIFFVQNVNGIDQVFRILSFCFGYISVKSITEGEKATIQEYIHPVFLTGILVSIYNNSILRKYVLLVYLIYFIYLALLTSNSISKVPTIINDSILTHLIFFFTKT